MKLERRIPVEGRIKENDAKYSKDKGEIEPFETGTEYKEMKSKWSL